MPSQLLNLRGLAARLPDTTLLQRFNKVYVATAIRDQQDAIVQYLGYDPLLDIRYGEGEMELVSGGDYVGNYKISTETWPLLNDAGPAIFNSLFFTYPNTYLPSIPVVTNHLKVSVLSGDVFIPLVLASGAYLGGDLSTVSATGWSGQYTAGYGTGVNDPTPSGSGTGFSATLTLANGQVTGYTNLVGGSGFKNPPVLVVTGNGIGASVTPVMNSGVVTDLIVNQPGQTYGTATIAVSSAPAFRYFPAPNSLIKACALLVQEQLQLGDPNNALSSMPLPQGGMISQLRTRTQSISFRPNTVAQGVRNITKATLGAGTPLSTEAMNLLYRFRVSRGMVII